MKLSFFKSAFLLLCIICTPLFSYAQPNFSHYPHDLSYFLPKSLNIGGHEVKLEGKFNNTPTPKEVLGFELGSRPCEWSDILFYAEALAAKSDRVRLVELGRSHEHRRFVQLIITSPKNQANLEQIKAEHLKLIDPTQSTALEVAKMPVIANICCSMHGNEASGANASLAVAYLLTASEDEAILNMLDNLVLLLVPGSNPDAINRFATLKNTTHGLLKNYDPYSSENQSVWPATRGNHYYTDTNRDLLMCQHPEGRIAVKQYLEWHPNMVIDLHEMGGTKARYFHSPGEPNRNYQYITDENQALTGEIGAYVDKALEPIGANPYSGKGFDDYYLGKGAAYGDIQGSVCLLHEQSNAGGYAKKYSNGVLTFPMTIRHQAEASIATLCAAFDMREKLLNYQRDFFVKSAAVASQSAVHGFIFNGRGDKARAYRLLENLLAHNIEVYHLAKDTKVGKEKFSAEDSFIIPLNQRYYYKVLSFWETLAADSFTEKKFYDVSTWTFPLAYNVAHAEVKSTEGLIGEAATLAFPEGRIIGEKSDKGYIVDAVALYSHNVLNALLAKGVSVKVATKPFKSAKQTMECGSAVVEVANQPISADAIYELLAKTAKENGVDVYAVDDKFNSEKLQLQSIRMPKVAILADKGIKANVMGEIWMLLEKHFGIKPARLTFDSVTKKSLAKYNVLIATHGTLPKKHKAYPALRAWIENGGTVISTGTGFQTAERAGLAAIKRLPSPDNKNIAERIAGAIINGEIDTNSPLGYGYTSKYLPLFRKGPQVYNEAEMKGYQVPVRYTSTPHLSGYISEKNIERIASTPAVMVGKFGNGQIIHFGDDPAFRSYWYGSTKMFMNAVYFGSLY